MSGCSIGVAWAFAPLEALLDAEGEPQWLIGKPTDVSDAEVADEDALTTALAKQLLDTHPDAVDQVWEAMLVAQPAEAERLLAKARALRLAVTEHVVRVCEQHYEPTLWLLDQYLDQIEAQIEDHTPAEALKTAAAARCEIAALRDERD